MCKLVSLKANENEIMVADIKKSAIENIINSASLCDSITKIVLFGSCIEERCKKDSDIDIAVFGKKPKNKCLSSASYRKFMSALNKFNDFSESYDVLYFQDGKSNNDYIMNDISRGALIYANE